MPDLLQPVRTPTVIRGGSEVERALRERIDELEEEVRQLRAYTFGEQDAAPVPAGVTLVATPRRIWGCLWHRRGRLWSRGELLDALYRDADSAPEPRILNVYICRLRQSLRGTGAVIETVLGNGWRLAEWPPEWEGRDA